MRVGNILFIERENHLVNYDSSALRKQKCLKVLPSQKSITQHKPLVCDFKIRKVKDTRIKFVPRRKIWEIHEGNAKSDFK